MNASAIRFCKYGTRAAAVLPVCVGALGVAGWITGLESLKTLFTGNVTIKANAALCLLLLGAALLALGPPGTAPRAWLRGSARAAALLAMTIGGLTFFEHVSDLDLGIDQMLAAEAPGAAATVSPGRMGPPASASFLLLGLSILRLDVRTRRGGVPAQWIALLVGLIALLPLIGYAYSIHTLYGIARFTGIALHTAISILSLAIGVLLARPTAGIMRAVVSDDAGGVLVRRMLLPAMLIPLALGWLGTIGERNGLFDANLGRPLLVLVLIASFAALVWWNGRVLSTVARQRSAAEAERDRLAAITRASREAMIGVGLDGRVQTWNAGAQRLFGYPADEIVGQSIGILVPADRPEQPHELFDRVRRGEALHDFDTVRMRKDGSLVDVSMSIDPVFDAAGSVVAMAGVIRDITERKQAEEELRRQKEAAEQASRAKDEFLATLSHELRTPLTPVLLSISLIEANPELPEQLREDVATIRRNVELESRLISDLLDLTRIEKGKLQLDIQDVDLHLVIRSAIEICQREASVKLFLELAADRHVVRGDSTRLQQVFWNLINNAIKFTGPFGTISVRTGNSDNGRRVRVEVIDTGVGIDPDVLPRLFTAFEQGETRAARQHAGLGLGLAISRRLVEIHGGTIWASSEGRGQGATFTVELPASDVYLAPAASRPALPEASNGRSLAVLLVEDHEPTLGVLTRLLRGLGHRVTGVSSASAALATASGQAAMTFDVIVCDLGLPDGSGLDVMRRLRDRYAGRAIALTGYGMESDVAASREAGFVEHLTKPVDLATLEAVLHRVAREVTE